jgi:hypothetical protein
MDKPMDRFDRETLEEAQETIRGLIRKVETTKEKFTEGSSHHTLQQNRLRALEVAEALLAMESAGDLSATPISADDLRSAKAPLASLISKSEKAREKVGEGTWQRGMLDRNLKALAAASVLLQDALAKIPGEAARPESNG